MLCVRFPKVAVLSPGLLDAGLELSIVILQESIFSIAEMEIKYLQLMQNSN